ncbi:MAG: TfoX/Sxy family protein [Alphaproteobacteria bacterium]|nr:TfoX/Sxy family protein [Alphaproteobacteria bacterium]
MSVAPEYLDHVLDLLGSLPGVAARRMFGGAGVWKSGVMFGLISDETLYFKVDEANRAAFKRAGTGPFVYGTKSGNKAVLSFYEVPAHLFDEPEEFAVWAREAVAAALRARKKAAPKAKPAAPRKKATRRKRR